MKKNVIILITALFLLNNICLSQNVNISNPKFFLSAGYGLAGSFFVRSYEEFAPLSSYKVFYKKNFVGVSQNAALGMTLKKNWEIKFGINYQHFTRRIKSKDTLNTAHIDLDHDIHNRDYIWFGNFSKKIEHKNHLIALGLGLYYIRSKAEVVEIFYPSYFADKEPEFKDSRAEEGGAFVEFAYEYKFQPKVNIGIKTQFYYTLSAGYAESVTLFPYVKILF